MTTTTQLPIDGVFDLVTGNLIGFASTQNTEIYVPIYDPATSVMKGPNGELISSGPKTVVASSTLSLAGGVNVINSVAGGTTTLQLSVPPTGSGEFRVRNGDNKSDTAVYLKHILPSIRMSTNGTNVTIPAHTLPATTDAGWTVAALVRVNSVNTSSGTTHCAFMKIGSGSAYFLLGYEGPNASNPGCLKVLMPNAAATGLVSVRSNSSPAPAFAPFASSNIGNWIWVFVRKHSAQLVENVLSLTTGLSTSATFSDETITLAWAPAQAPDSSGVQVYAGSVNIASGNYSAPNAAVVVGPDSSATGSYDVSKVVLINQTLTQDQMRELAKGKRPQDFGVTVNNSTDFYYDLTSSTATELVDLLGGTAVTSVTLTGADGLTPSANRISTLQYIGNTGANRGWLQGSFLDGVGYKDGPQA